MTEEARIAPLSNHGAGKAAQELFCQSLRARGHAVTILRPSNAYGPGQTLRQGFGLIRTMLECARMAAPLEIWGDGENVRDFIYIDDVVEATICLIGMPQYAGTYNLGSDTSHSINQVKSQIETLTEQQLQTIYRPARGIDVRSVELDNSRLTTQLGWRPSVELASGIARMWDWVRQSI